MTKTALPEKIKNLLWAETARYLLEKAERTSDPVRQMALLDQAARAERQVPVARWLLADGVATIVSELWGAGGWMYRQEVLAILTAEGEER
jgi:hypothetical protein